MNVDVKQLVILFSQWVITAVILAWEQSFSLPFLFFILALISVRLQPKYYREVLLVLLGLSFAGLYNLWFGVGVIWLFALLALSYAIGRFIPTVKLRVTLASLVGSLLLAQVTGLEITLTKAVLVGLTMVLFWIVSIFVRWDVRSIPISKANWGWPKV